ncbi:MAG: GNAT family N-acetyltransferase [Desulfatibacillum sp.]|nr:GNAT family N-acetyltransferase [Desulfatibacillum sp.]
MLENLMMSKKKPKGPWLEKLTTPEKVLTKIKPGMCIFLSTGVAEPRTLVKHLMASQAHNLQDLELIQMISLGDAISGRDLHNQKFRLKTFFSGWVASEPISSGQVDLIPANYSRIPGLIESGRIRIDVAFVKITPFDDTGYASLGVSVDLARQAMERADIVVGEISDKMPRTYGDTFVHVNDFDYLVENQEPPLLFPRSPVDEVFDHLAQNVASLISDGSCLSFSMEPLFEALWPHLAKKKDLGIHSGFFSDPLMDLVKSGAVTNRHKGSFRGKCLASYALGTAELMKWLHKNPLVEFQALDILANPALIGKNPKTVAILPVRRVALSGQFAFHHGKGNVGMGPGEVGEYVIGARMSKGGRVIVALPSRNREGKPNIVLSVEGYPNVSTNAEIVDIVVTEYGVANMMGRSLRERAQVLIDIAHPDDRQELMEMAKEKHLLYKDQICVGASGHLYPHQIAETQAFRDNTVVRFRPIRPSDEEEMRRLFYRFSSEAVYYRYFSPVKTMPHSKMQEYVNVDYSKAMSIVGLVGDPGQGRIIAEARYVKLADSNWADSAFIVDEGYGGRGIASYMLGMLIRIAKEKGIEGFTSDVLSTNKAMMKVYEKSNYPVKASLADGAYHLTMDFNCQDPCKKRPQ